MYSHLEKLEYYNEKPPPLNVNLLILNIVSKNRPPIWMLRILNTVKEKPPPFVNV